MFSGANNWENSRSLPALFEARMIFCMGDNFQVIVTDIDIE
jgi:hypothetical protein